MELSELCGKLFVLDGRAEYTLPPRRMWEDSIEASAVRLNGRWYVFQVDPLDGYRSCLGEIHVLDDPPPNAVDMPPVHVYGKMQDEILQFYEGDTLVAEFGTDRNDDYYPSFVGVVHIRSLSFNRGNA